MSKSILRHKILKNRKKFNNQNIELNFNNIFKLIKNNFSSKKIIGGYFPVNHEVSDLEILKEFSKRKYKISLPVIKKKFQMDYYEWSFNEPLKINKYGIPEPSLKELVYPDIILVPLVAFDKELNRLGYGGGYYDRFIEKLMKKKNILKIGMALSIQKINTVPINKFDKKLDYIITEKYSI